ncbi:Zinc finger protein 3 [Collichthys lucidus]|uniref:Zinc finger protein 3 n=1 Tax=Collichthys lucidus TaxID=240159 RepID=A0A4U5VDF7_COLLU|nr:Zinc finger protein 3 [Collichthys lucidus]
MRQHTGEKPYYCAKCGKSFASSNHFKFCKMKKNLKVHQERFHEGQKAFKCLECNKEFDQRHHLIQHVRIHTGEKPFSCDYCEKTFSNNSSRIAHMRQHTGEKPYYCAKCGKSFTSSSHFKFCKMKEKFESAPGKVNTDENPKEDKTFKCSECSRMFRQQHQLIRHQRIHTGEKPFSCDVCGKTFSRSSTRNDHMRVHTGEKPYLCKNCGKRFACKKHLTWCTVSKKSAAKSFHCTTCGKFFHTEIDLNVHMHVHESWRRHMSEKLQEQTVAHKSNIYL